VEAVDSIPLMTGKADVTWQLEVPMEVPVQDALYDVVKMQAETLVTAGLVLASGEHIEAHVQADIRLARDVLQWKLSAPSSITWSDNQHLQRIQVQTRKAAGRLEFTHTNIVSYVEPEAQFIVEVAGVPDVALSPLELQLPQGLSLDFDMSRSRLHATRPLLATIEGGGAEWSGNTVKVDEVELVAEKLWQEQGQWDVQARIKAAGIVAVVDGHALAASHLEGGVQFAGEQIESQLVVGTDAGGLKTNVKVRHDLREQQGRLDVELSPTILGKNNLLLSSLYQPWPYPFDLDAGVVSGRSMWEWGLSVPEKDNAPEFKIGKTYRFKLEQLGGHYDKHAFVGLNAHGVLEDMDGLHTVEPVQIEVEKIDVGMEVESIRLGLGYQQGRAQDMEQGKTTDTSVLNIYELNARVLGGSVASDHIELDLARAQNDFVVQLQGVDVAKILETQGHEGLQGSGIIDGLLPVSLSAKGVTVKQGVLQARAPGGVIRYHSGESGQSLQGVDPSIKLMMQTLENFHYTLLKSELDYSEDGNLVMKMRLEGRNPDAEAKNPVHLNLNVEQNVLSLLKSLHLADELGEKLGGAYK
jgi:hypothetical protein